MVFVRFSSCKHPSVGTFCITVNTVIKNRHGNIELHLRAVFQLIRFARIGKEVQKRKVNQKLKHEKQLKSVR